MITGGLGFIGSNLAHALVEVGARVLIVDSLLPNCGGNLFNIDDIKEKVEVNFTDIRDQHSMNQLIRDQEYIFNLAAQVSHTGSMKDPLNDLDINCRGHLTLLEACRKYNSGAKIVYAGTRGQYGRSKYLPVDEEHPMNPTDINGINKLSGEKYHLLYNHIYGIKATSLRMSNTYGPRHQMRHSWQGVINWFIRLAIDGETIKIYGNGKQIRDCNYVDDVISALLMVASIEKSYGEVYNLGGEPISLIYLVKLITKITGKGKYELVPYPKGNENVEIGDYVADYSKIKNEVGWEPKIPLEDGLKKTISFYEENKTKYWK